MNAAYACLLAVLGVAVGVRILVREIDRVTTFPAGQR